MPTPDWDARYAEHNTPWDTGQPDAHLVRLVEAGEVPVGRALEIGCGTGTNALWLAANGYEVDAVDLSPLAVSSARAKSASQTASPVRFAALDFLTDPAPGEAYDFVFDRGCFHIFEDPAVRQRFAARVAQLLAPGGTWVSLIGSTEGPPRDVGPPRRSARDVVGAIEPALEVVTLSAVPFDTVYETAPAGWLCVARRR